MTGLATASPSKDGLHVGQWDGVSDERAALVQHYLECDGTDLRIVIVNGEIVAAMERRAQPGEFRANLARGGSARPYHLDDATAKLALDAAALIGLDLVGMDIGRPSRTLEQRTYLPAGMPFWIEANPFPGLRGLWNATGCNAADPVIALLLDKLHHSR